MKKILLLVLLIPSLIVSQTNPTPQSIPYSQDFSSLEWTSTTYPSGIQGWVIGSAATTSFRTTLATGDQTLAASSSASTTTGGVHNFNGKIGFLSTGSLDPSICMSINTSNKKNICVQYDVMTMRNPYNGSTNTRINEVTLQYRIGSASSFTTLTGIEYQNNTTSQTSGTTGQNIISQSITLPEQCDNQASIQLRFVVRDVSGSGSRPSFAFDNIIITGSTIITFTDGSEYSAPIGTPNTNNNPIGRFLLTGADNSGRLTGATISLSGTRTGISQLKLWSSSDNSFNSSTDTQLAISTDGLSATFSSFSSEISTNGTYYFLTADLDATASGSISAKISNTNDLTFSSAALSGTISNAVLSAESNPLPVELTYFKALVEKEKVKLNWSTATEVNNYGFEIERKSSNSDWKKIGFVQGHGNSNSPKNYTYSDQPLGDVTFKYRLKQVDFDGTFEYSNEVEVKLDEIKQFVLEQNYPNPFNPTTTIRFSLPVATEVSISVFNLLGERVAQILNSNLNEGYHEVTFDGSSLTSGIYFYQLRAGEFKATKKFIITK